MIRVERIEKRAASRCQADDLATQEEACDPVSFALVFENGNGAGGHSHSTQIRVCELHARQLLEGLSRELCPLCGGAGVVYGGILAEGDPCALCTMLDRAKPAEAKPAEPQPCKLCEELRGVGAPCTHEAGPDLDDVLAPAGTPKRKPPEPGKGILVGRLPGTRGGKLHGFYGTGHHDVSSGSFCGRVSSCFLRAFSVVTPEDLVTDHPGDKHQDRLCRQCFSWVWVGAMRRAAGFDK